MATTFTIDPITRIEGHLKIEVTVEMVAGEQQVIDARCSGTMFRGFEKILLNHDPMDAPHFTQRICGVCPISHGIASCMALESAAGAAIPANGRILRNLVLGANYLQSHILHFYHLAALDYIDTTGILDMSPWVSRYVSDDMVSGDTALALVGHYVQALEIRRKAHQMGAIFGGRMPCSPSLVPGGCTHFPTTAQITAFRTLLTEIRSFIDTVFVPDAVALAGLFPQYYEIGAGCGNLLAYGVFDLNAAGTSKLLARGRYTNGGYYSVDPALITEDVNHSWYSSPTHLNPASGQTEANASKVNAYSWVKSPRYSNVVHEVGPLARMWVNGDYRGGISTLDRLAARAYEAKKIADAMVGWLTQLTPNNSGYSPVAIPASGSGIGLYEAPRGALGHWANISSSRISRYQVITPTAWNASPQDDLGQKGPIEQALIGTPVVDVKQPVEILRVIHSFDPCLSCSVHMLRAGAKEPAAIVPVEGGV